MLRAPSLPEAPDILIIGGGINGIAAFADLSLQGLDVVLIERGDFCQGASAALSRMVHGGLRYLENGEFRLVHESLVERNRLLKNAPHQVFPLPTLVPITGWWQGFFPTIARFLKMKTTSFERPGVMVRLGLCLYDILSIKGRSMPTHRVLNRRQLDGFMRGLTKEAVAAALYYDARVMLPERVGLELILDTEASTKGRAFSYHELTGRDGDSFIITDTLSGQSQSIRPKMVVNATGAWVDFVAERLGPPQKRRVQGTKGSHLMLKNPQLYQALGENMVYYANRDGRICIAYNHLGLSLIGTTDIRIDDPDKAFCEADEQAYMIEAIGKIFPDLIITDDQIVHLFTGVRPLPFSETGSTGTISRDHAVEVDKTGSVPILTLIGGKWTTFRAFGEDVADAALSVLGLRRKQSTTERAIGGGKNFPTDQAGRAALTVRLMQQFAQPQARIDALLARYGSRAEQLLASLNHDDHPLTHAPDYSSGEILWLCAHEHVRDLADLLMRRTALGLQGRVNADLCDELSRLIAAPLGWSDDERLAAIARLETRLKLHHRVANCH